MLDPVRRAEWFVSERGKLSGPHGAERIRDLVRWGKVSERAYLCDSNGSAWIPIRCSAVAALLGDEIASPARVNGRAPSVRPAAHPFGLAAAVLVLGVIVVTALQG